ncbi:MAG: small multi-drug export protein [Ignavibacteriaceae bacterium]
MDNLTEVLKIFLTSLTPIGELRASIPLGLTVFHQPIWVVLMVKSKLMNKFLTWLFERTRKKTKDKIEKYGDLALIIFVAIPLPNTGAWTGALAAWLFGIPFKKAVPNIFYGVLIAGAVVTLITTGLKNLFP